MQKVNGEWVVQDLYDFIGWEIVMGIPDIENMEYVELILVNKVTRQTRKVRSHILHIPIHSLEPNE